MADFSSTGLEPSEMYKLITGCIVPRPIAFVSTRSREGVVNLAPFSFFNGIAYNPPTIGFSVIDRAGEMKDTSRNISEHPEFVVHIVSENMVEQMNATCGDYGPHVDEFGVAGLTATPGTQVDVPRVAEALVALECRLSQHLRLGATHPHTSFIMGEVIHWHLDDRLLNERMHINPAALDAVGRMGGTEYTRTRDRFALDRPVIAPEDPRSIPAYKSGQGKKQ